MGKPGRRWGSTSEVERSDTSLTEEIIEALTDIVRKGNFRYIAATRIGVSPNTLAGWVRRGKRYIKKGEHNKLQAKLVTSLLAAEAECHEKLLQDVLEHGSPDLRFRFMTMRYSRLYTHAGKALDDETGEETKVSSLELLRERLSAFLEDDG